MMRVIYTTFVIFTITTVTATVNEELFQKGLHEAQLPKNNSFGFPSVLSVAPRLS